MATQMRIQKRVTDVRRHTKGYIVDGQRKTRGQVVKMARSNKIKDVYASKGASGWYISSLPSAKRSLYDLPVVVED
jgi:hypothetical protein